MRMRSGVYNRIREVPKWRHLCCTRWTSICFLTIRGNKTNIDIINRGELEENISGISCMRLEWSQGDGRAAICVRPSCTVETGETFWKLVNFAFISSILNKNGFKSILCPFIHEVFELVWNQNFLVNKICVSKRNWELKKITVYQSV